jgi:hypothetical protein
MRHIITLVAVVPLVASASGGWPGVPPDCWTDARLVHSVQDLGEVWRENIKITTRKGEKLKSGILSPNGGYFFTLVDNRPKGRISIYAEKDHVLELDFSELFGLSDVRWVNEKLLFVHAWWGRIAATDMLFDVEAEKFVYIESVTDGMQAMQQYRESCPLLGCECIKKK